MYTPSTTLGAGATYVIEGEGEKGSQIDGDGETEGRSREGETE